MIEEAGDPNPPVLTEDQKASILLFFKTCITSKHMCEIKEKLKETGDLRTQLLDEKETNNPEIFPFYFTAPTLVRFKKSG